MDREKIGAIFVEKGYISPEQLKEALSEQELSGENLGQLLLRRGVIDRKQLDEVLDIPGVNVFDINNYIINEEVNKLIPEDIVIMYKVMPVYRQDKVLTVAMAKPDDLAALGELVRLTGLEIKPLLAKEEDIYKLHSQCYKDGREVQKIVASIDEVSIKKGEKLGGSPHVISLVDLLIKEAIEAGASDIHIEPEEKNISIRYRIDGVLYHHAFLPKYIGPVFISRLKVMAGLDIAEKRLPQDGRMMVKIGTKEIDFRVSACPTFHGENIVLRILDRSTVIPGLENLGFPPDDLEKFLSMLKQPYGMIFITGPTGSGKTTTLYTALKKINREDINIMSVEDPVEYNLARIRQVQINPRIGLTFAYILRSFLRQDPNVIMIGEIRDFETAEIAIQAALTGHLVISSLHTNDAPSAFTRLINMGMQPYSVASSLLGVVAQRLVRKICPKCKIEFSPSPFLLKSLGLEGRINRGNLRLFKPNGCPYCNNTGYKGRIGVFEVLKVSTRIQNLILEKASTEEINRVGREEGMRTLKEAVVNKLLVGITSPEEVIRITQAV